MIDDGDGGEEEDEFAIGYGDSLGELGAAAGNDS